MNCTRERHHDVDCEGSRRREVPRPETHRGRHPLVAGAARVWTAAHGASLPGMWRDRGAWARLILLVVAATAHPRLAGAGTYTLVGWNNLGMHCMDADYSVSALLPPYNTVQAQLIDPQGMLVRDPAGITVTYEAVADPDGSINSTSIGKTNFWTHAPALFGVSLPDDAGLAGHDMPGVANQPQSMRFDAAAAGFVAEGIPITPFDDAHRKNTYPLMRLVARDDHDTLLAATDIVVPVSDEMNCTACHLSGSSASAQPNAGWVNDPDPERDVRLNVLRLHDDREGANDTFKRALVTAGYNPAGLFATATADGTSVLCARCHRSEALSDSGLPGITPLTQAVHRRMAGVFDPVSGMVLGAIDNRSACYRCHPGTTTRCLRGVMGNAVAADGSRAMQCQSCHGSMLDVASPTRTGWLDEPACQGCHTGTAVSNSGQIRYSSVFDAPGHTRAAADLTFATNPDTPATGQSLYRFSSGHGGLQCPACHGSTHAEFASSQRNDNLQSVATQGHVGVLVECQRCHGATPNTVDGGPHGMHPVGQEWVNRHPDVVGDDEGAGATQCRGCHGADYRGTVLSRVQADRTVNTEELGSRHFWRGFQVGCYTCHRGPGGEGRNPNRPAVVSSASVSTSQDTPVLIPLSATDPDQDTLTVRIVSQPSHGTAGLDGATAEYFPDAGFTGSDAFSFAAWDGSTDSNLGTVSLSVSAATASATASPSPTVSVPATSTPTGAASPTVAESPRPTPTLPASPTPSLPPNPTRTLPASPTATMVVSPTPNLSTATPTASPGAGSCVGDCDGNAQVTIDEVLTGVNLALGFADLAQCPTFDCNGTGLVSIDCLLQAVSAALADCRGTALPTATSTRTATVTQTPLGTPTPSTQMSTATPFAAATETATLTPTPTPTRTLPTTQTPPPTPTPTRTTTTTQTATPAQAVSPTPTLAPPTPTGTTTTNLDPTLANIQATIFSTSCTDLACHSSLVQAGNLVLEAGKAHDQLVGVKAFNLAAQQAGLVRVTPGDPSSSFLVIKLTGPSALQGSAMPLGKPPLTAAQIQLIRDWITQGAAP